MADDGMQRFGTEECLDPLILDEDELEETDDTDENVAHAQSQFQSLMNLHADQQPTTFSDDEDVSDPDDVDGIPNTSFDRIESTLAPLPDVLPNAPPPDARTSLRHSNLPVRRKQIIQELFDTEKKYIKALKRVTLHYINPMVKLGLIPKESEFRSLFGAFPIMIKNHEEMLEMMEDSTIETAQVFLSQSDHLMLYSSYFKRYEKIRTRAREIRDESPEIDKFIRDAGDDMEMNFSAPTFRIPRYVLLLKELLKYTPDSHGEHEPLIQALSKLESVLQNLNEKTRVDERLKMTTQVSGRLKGLSPHGSSKPGMLSFDDLLSADRVCLMDVECLRYSTGRFRRRKAGRVIIFNDMLIVTDVDYNFRQGTAYADIATINDYKEAGNKKYTAGMQILLLDKPEIVVWAENQNDLESWKNAIGRESRTRARAFDDTPTTPDMPSLPDLDLLISPTEHEFIGSRSNPTTPGLPGDAGLSMSDFNEDFFSDSPMPKNTE